jgi:hypothetical protein
MNEHESELVSGNKRGSQHPSFWQNRILIRHAEKSTTLALATR